MPQIFDVAVAGGGIAGAAACLALAGHGLRTCWLAPPAPAGDRPGESLSATARPMLAALGLKGLLDAPAHRPVAASFASWGTDALLERSAIATPGGMGHVVDRARLEHDLADAAARADGVRVLPHDLADFAREGGGWQVHPSGTAPLRARFLVDATGRRAAIGRRLAGGSRVDRLVAAYAFLRQVDRGVDPTPATLVEAVAGGWWYATLLPDGRLVVNFYSDPDLLPRGIRRDPAAWQCLAGETRYIARWLESAGFTLAAPPRLASAGTGWLARAAGDDWIAVGDAAAAFDPLSAHGMTAALWSGIHGAAAVRDALAGASGATAAYDGRVRQGIARYRAGRQAVYAAETRFAPHPFWSRRQGTDGPFPQPDDDPARTVRDRSTAHRAGPAAAAPSRNEGACR